MSCEPRPIATISRCALPVVLILAATPSATFAEAFDCHPIRGRETATQVARRLTGDSRNTYQPWFQIMDSASRFVPKSQYHRVRPGWRACTSKAAVDSRVQSTAIRPVSVQPDPIQAANIRVERPQAATPGFLQLIDGVDFTLLWIGAAAIVPWFGWKVVDGYIHRRNAVSIVMQHFAHRFVREFERPLIQRQTERPVRSRVRLSPVRGRLDILLAPGEGRRYPNLADHKKNFEYDVVRIQRLLADESFVREPLYTRAGWVIVPFRVKAVRKHTGVA
jgi:hypothetical protein